MKIYWQIVPIGDGYRYVGKDGDSHILCFKSDPFNKTLLFKTASECKEYINANFDPEKFVEEEVLLDAKYFGLE